MASDIKVRVYHTDIFKAHGEDEKMGVEKYQRNVRRWTNTSHTQENIAR